MGRKAEAAEAYARALENNPRNAYAPSQRRVIEELEASLVDTDTLEEASRGGEGVGSTGH